MQYKKERDKTTINNKKDTTYHRFNELGELNNLRIKDRFLQLLII